MVTSWPPVMMGSIRFLCAGLLLLVILRYTKLLGEFEKVTPELRRQLWLRGGLSLAAYTITFNWALRLTSASHVALYIGASPIWALLAEERPRRTWASVRRYSAALLAVAGVMVLFWPTLKAGSHTSLLGELSGLTASFMWALYSRQSRWLSARVNGAGSHRPNDVDGRRRDAAARIGGSSIPWNRNQRGAPRGFMPVRCVGRRHPLRIFGTTRFGIGAQVRFCFSTI